MHRTGQAKKFAEKESSDTWGDEISAAYEAAKDVKDNIIADYVAIDQNNQPVGTSSLAKVFLDYDGYKEKDISYVVIVNSVLYALKKYKNVLFVIPI